MPACRRNRSRPISPAGSNDSSLSAAASSTYNQIGYVPLDEHPGRGGGYFLCRHAAGTDRDRYHQQVRTIHHSRQRHRAHTIRSDMFPSMNIPVVVVATFYAGMPPEQIETDITSRFERFFTLGSGIEHIESDRICSPR